MTRPSRPKRPRSRRWPGARRPRRPPRTRPKPRPAATRPRTRSCTTTRPSTRPRIRIRPRSDQPGRRRARPGRWPLRRADRIGRAGAGFRRRRRGRRGRGPAPGGRRGRIGHPAPGAGRRRGRPRGRPERRDQGARRGNSVTNYPRSAYGSSNPNAGYPANGDRAAFGGHAWPAGVPTGLLARTTYTSSKGQRNFVVMRRELVPLWNLAFEICDRKHGYTVWSNHNGENWGPWGYENRAISGTSTASGHSMGLSVDITAPFNPYSYTFQSDMPPKMVADLESLGLYWGGRYQGQKYDAMHFGFCRAPGTLGQYIAKARAILGKPAPKPPAPKPPTKVTGTPKPKKTATYNPAGRKPVWPL